MHHCTTCTHGCSDFVFTGLSTFRFVQASGIISAQIYRKDDAPNCKNCLHSTAQMLTLVLDRRGNRILIAICCFNMFIMYPGAKAYYIYRNRQRDRIWNAMTLEVHDMVFGVFVY